MDGEMDDGWMEKTMDEWNDKNMDGWMMDRWIDKIYKKINKIK